MSDPAASPDSAAPAADQPAVSWWRFWLTLIIVVLADQLSKFAVAATIPAGGSLSSEPGSIVTVIPGFFYLIHVFNTGAAWSIFAGYASVLGIIGILAVLAILLFRRSFQLYRPAMQWIFGLLCGGIIGNAIDRLLYGHVVDFIDLHFGSYRYPTFNIADSAIVIGVIVYLLWSFLPGSASARK